MKKWYQSKTIWANIIILVLGTVGEYTKTFSVSENPKVWMLVTFVLNSILRLITTEPISK